MEGEKNKLENLLHNNLMKKRDRILHDLQEVSVADRRQKLDQYQTELEQEDEKLVNFKEQTKGSNVMEFMWKDIQLILKNIFRLEYFCLQKCLCVLFIFFRARCST